MCWFCQELCRHGQVPRAAAAWRNARRPIRKLDAVCAIKTIIIQCCYASLLFFPSKIQTSSRTLNTQTSSRTRFPCLTYICPLWKPSFTWSTEMSVLHLHVKQAIASSVLSYFNIFFLCLLFASSLVCVWTAFTRNKGIARSTFRTLHFKQMRLGWRTSDNIDDSFTLFLLLEDTGGVHRPP